MTKDERESIFIISDADTEWSVCSFQSKMWSKLEKQGYIPYKTDILDGQVIGKYYKVPYTCVSIRKNVKRVVSKEQKLAAAERMKKIHKNKTQDKI